MHMNFIFSSNLNVRKRAIIINMQSKLVIIWNTKNSWMYCLADNLVQSCEMNFVFRIFLLKIKSIL